jgi:hypothetical protein
VIKRLLTLIALQTLLISTGYAATKYREVTVADAYLELHTGPGRGYPVFWVVDRGLQVSVIMRRTDWFKVRTDRGIEGWVARKNMLATLEALGEHQGEKVDLHEPARDDFRTRRWEGAIYLGDYAGADEISMSAGFALSDNMSAELTASHAVGRFSDSVFGALGLAHVFAPEWRISPLVTIGAGLIHTSPHATLVSTQDRNDEFAYVGVGVRGYLTRRFSARLEYRSNIIFTNRDENEEISEWKLGFAFFF